MMIGSPIGSQLESLPQSDDEVDMEDEDEKDEEAEDDLTMPATPNTSQESLPPGQGTPFNAVVPASRKEPPDQPAELDADRIAADRESPGTCTDPGKSPDQPGRQREPPEEPANGQDSPSQPASQPVEADSQLPFLGVMPETLEDLPPTPLRIPSTKVVGRRIAHQGKKRKQPASQPPGTDGLPGKQAKEDEDKIHDDFLNEVGPQLRELRGEEEEYL